jgi:hypothetical protein
MIGNGEETNCQILGFVCDEKDVCSRCGGTGDEPLTAKGSDPCMNCSFCFDEEMGWSTGVNPKSLSLVRVKIKWREACS